MQKRVFGYLMVFLGLLVTTARVSAEPIDFAGMKAGHWYVIPGTPLSDAFPDPAPPGVLGPKGVVRAWGGGAFDSKRERLLLWGGGHTDYAGNEIYAFDINATDPKWERITEPSMDVGGSEQSGVYPDGLPRSRHTYSHIEYIPSVDEFCSFGAAGTYPNASYGLSSMHCYDFENPGWQTGVRSAVPAGDRHGFAVYDPVTNKVWYRAAFSNGLYQYNPTTDVWSPQYGANQWMEYFTSAAVDTRRHQLAAIGKGQLFVWDLDNPGSAATPASSGATSIESATGPGFQYDSNVDKYVGWKGNEQIYILDPETWEWRTVSPAPTSNVDVPSALSNGTYGRFRYIPSKNVYILYNDYHQDVYFFKLSDADGVVQWPVLDFAASRTNIESGESVTLTWSVANANRCTASGGWSGEKTIGSGIQETVGPLTTSAAFELTCSGTAGTVSVSVPVTIAGAPVATVNVSATTPSHYVWTTLSSGTEVYIDRSYTYTSIPSGFEGLDVLQTANDDKQASTNPFVTFQIDQPTTVYVGHDADSGAVPSWLSSWTATGEVITNSDKALNVYKKDFQPGTVTLGGNEGDTESSNYVVFLKSDTRGGMRASAGGGSSGGALGGLSCLVLLLVAVLRRKQQL